jgi:ArsR family transcriptional regulator, arsenate/arsenite/antimonite-responsive transcriptional repressor
MKELPLLADVCCVPGATPITQPEAEQLARRFRALGDPTRVAIVNLLAAAGAGEVCVCELVAGFDLAQPTISHHLKVLRDAGLVEARRRGTWAYYRLVPEAVEALSRSLAA